MMTDVPAALYGLRDRGRVAEGFVADLVVFDPATVASEPARARTTCPAAASASLPMRAESTACSSGVPRSWSRVCRPAPGPVSCCDPGSRPRP